MKKFLVVMLLLISVPASAGMMKCLNEEGTVYYTNTGQCPEGYEPEGGYQTTAAPTPGRRSVEDICKAPADYEILVRCRLLKAQKDCAAGNQGSCREKNLLYGELNNLHEDWRMQRNIRQGVWGR